MSNEITKLRSDLDTLLTTKGPCISLFLPTEKSGRETLQGAIHLKNLVSRTEATLLESGTDKKEAETILAPARKLIEDKEFWQHQNHGLAIFLAPDFERTYTLPLSVSLRSSIDDNFDFVPLLPLLTIDGRFYILTLSESEVKLFEATRFSIQEFPVNELPTSMDEALFADVHEKQLQSHSAGRDSSGGQQAVFHGSGDEGTMEQRKTDLKRFFDKVDASLDPHFKTEPAPVVLAGVDYLLPIYRHANGVAEILDGEIHGNQSHRPQEELLQDAWAIAEPHFKARQYQAKEHFNQIHGQGLSSTDLDQILQASAEGRIDTLFIRRVENPGVNEATSDSLNGKLSQATVQTLKTGGKVFSPIEENMPTDEAVAAIFRY